MITPEEFEEKYRPVAQEEQSTRNEKYVSELIAEIDSNLKKGRLITKFIDITSVRKSMVEDVIAEFGWDCAWAEDDFGMRNIKLVPKSKGEQTIKGLISDMTDKVAEQRIATQRVIDEYHTKRGKLGFTVGE